MSQKLPAMMFYPGDWMRDPELRSVSYAARGLWIDLCCHLWNSPERGFLVINGTPATNSQIARMTGGGEIEVSALVSELESAGVFSRDDRKCIYCRRMRRDEEKREKCSEAGKRGGGNPNFKRRPLGPPLERPLVGAHKGAPVIENEYVIEDETVNKEELLLARKIPPTIESVKAEGVRIMLGVEECDAFFDYYESNGWMVGKNKMKNWCRSLMNWKRRKGEFSNGTRINRQSANDPDARRSAQRAKEYPEDANLAL